MNGKRIALITLAVLGVLGVTSRIVTTDKGPFSPGDQGWFLVALGSALACAAVIALALRANNAGLSWAAIVVVAILSWTVVSILAPLAIGLVAYILQPWRQEAPASLT